VRRHRGRLPALAIALTGLLAATHAATQSPPDSTSPTGDTLSKGKVDTASQVRSTSSAGHDPRLGERTYMKNCANCHRADGRGGRQPTATGEPVPSFRTPGYWETKTDSALVAVVENGVPNTSMVSFKDVLTVEEIRAVTHFVRQRFGPRKRPSGPATTAPDSGEAADSADA
jgi:mono/diheme cytochrome c family protein